MTPGTAAGTAVRAGQRGILSLRFERRGKRTVLAERYSKAPFGSVRAGYPDTSGIAEVQVTNPGGGVLGGDDLATEVHLGAGAAATILTQGATKVYRGAASVQRASFELGDGALLEYLPHHLIPYAGSSCRQTADFHLSGEAGLMAWEAYSAGRVARGELFAFEKLSGKTRIFRDGTPEVIDGFELSGGDFSGEPSGRKPFGGEIFGGYLYTGALYVCAPGAGELAEGLHGALSGVPGVAASASAASGGLCAVRVLAANADGLYRVLNVCRPAARAYLGLPSPPRRVW